MNSRVVKRGFTLIEILVAMTIIASIVSMVYGSYFATSKSVEACKARIAISGKAQKVLQQMACQIRCTYPGPIESITKQENKKSESKPNYFNGSSIDPTGEILHMLTTNAIFKDGKSSDGLFEVTYKFDKDAGLLFLSQERFAGVAKRVSTKRNWRLLARNIELVELGFFDGRRWLSQWDFEDKMEPPLAVRISLTFIDDNHQQYRYSTVAYICCQRNQRKKGPIGHINTSK